MFQRTKICTGLMLAFGGGLWMAALPAVAQETQRVEITGSSIKRVDAETALPVTVMRREDIERTGATTAQDLVNMLPSNFGGGVVANNVGATGVASTANLRSLGSKYTLVLLNGRRVANYAFGNSPVDLNSIPLSAIERIEVLRDGASAVYGADAVAGVINFILRKDYQGIEGTIYGTKTQQGGGDTKSVNITGGFGDLASQRFNVLISANHEEDDVLKAKDRSFAGTANRPDLGINKASPRNGIPNLNFTDTLGNRYTGVNPFRYKNCDNADFALVVISNKGCGTDYVKFIDLIPEQRHDNVVARGVFQLNDDNQLYAEAVRSKDHVVATYSPAPYTKNMTYPTNGRWYPKSIVIPKGYVVPANTTYRLADGSTLAGGTVLDRDIEVTPTGPLSGTWRTVAGGGRTDITDTTNDRILFGAKGTLAGWDYDTALSYSKNDGTISFGPGKFSYAKLTPLVNSGEINVFGAQDAASLAALNGALLNGPEQSAISKATEFDFRVSREIAQLPAGPMGLALGLSMRKEKLEQISYPVLASGDEVGGSGEIPTVTGSRKVYGLFAETSIPVLKSLELGLAARYDNYKNSFGTSFNKVSPKASLRFQPMKELLVRGSYGTGYRAPTLYENLRPQTFGNNTAGNWSDPIRCPGGNPIDSVNPVGDIQDECNVQLNASVKGEQNLKPEKSNQYTLGLVFQPMPSLNIGVDYWNVKITGAIQGKSEILVLSNPNTYKDFLYRYDPNDPANWCDPSGFSPDPTCVTKPLKGNQNKDFPLAYVYLPYENTAKFYASGVDLSINWKQKFGSIGTFGVDLEGTYYTKHGYQYEGAADTSDVGAYKDFGPVPRWRHVLTFSYSNGPWAGSLSHNYTSGYFDYTNPDAVGPNYPASRKVGAYETLDAQVSWRGIKNLDVALGVKNLLDRDPPSSRTEANFQTGYDATFTNPLGRTYYARVRYKFF